jgi:hypothetical protein
MSKHRVAVLKVASGQLSVTAAAAHGRQRVLAIVDEREVTVVALATCEMRSGQDWCLLMSHMPRGREPVE